MWSAEGSGRGLTRRVIEAEWLGLVFSDTLVHVLYSFRCEKFSLLWKKLSMMKN